MDGLNDFGLLSMAAVAKLLHCSKAHVSNVIAGRVRGCLPLPAVHLGRRTLVRQKTLEAWVERNEKAVANDNVPPSPVRVARSPRRAG